MRLLRAILREVWGLLNDILGHVLVASGIIAAAILVALALWLWFAL